MIQIIVNIFGLIEEKLNVTGKLFLISIKTYRLKNIEKNLHQILHLKLIKYLKVKNIYFLSLYEDICDEKEFILMSEESFIQHDVKNKQLKEENEKLRKENENKKLKTRNEKVETKNEKREITN